MSFRDFRYITPRQFFLKLDGYHERIESEYKTEMEIKRFYHVAYMNFNLPTGKQYKSDIDWHKFPWEKQKQVEVLTNEQIDEQIEKMSKAWKI